MGKGKGMFLRWVIKLKPNFFFLEFLCFNSLFFFNYFNKKKEIIGKNLKLFLCKMQKLKKKNIFFVTLRHNSVYKPILNSKKFLTNKHIYIKNYLYFFLFLNYFKSLLGIVDFSIVFFKKKKYFKNILRSPNRHKKAQTKLIFKYYFSFLNIKFSSKILFKSSFFFLYIFSLFFFKFFKFFESSLLSLDRKKIQIFFEYEL